MVLRTLDGRFQVMQVLRRGEQDEICLCRALTETDGELFTLARFRDPALHRYLLPMLSAQQSNRAFSDYLGVSVREGELWVKFRHSPAPTLTQRLEKGLELQERLTIGGNLLERMTLLDMPPALQFEALRERNLTVDDGLGVRFNYVLEPMTACFNVDMGYINVRVEEVLRQLFAPELENRSAPELEDYLKLLEGAACKTYLEMYSGYDRVRTALLSRTLTAPPEPQTWLFRLWAKIKKLGKYVRPVLAALVILAAAVYLIYNLLHPGAAGVHPSPIEQIGTVQVGNVGGSFGST